MVRPLLGFTVKLVFEHLLNTKYALGDTYLRERSQRIYSRAVNGTSIHGAHRENVTLLVHHDKWHVITLAISWSPCFPGQGNRKHYLETSYFQHNTNCCQFYDIKRIFELLLGLNFQFYCVAKLLKRHGNFIYLL